MRLMVSTSRLKPVAKNSVGGQTSLNSLIRNARTPDLDINGLLRTFAPDIPDAARPYDFTSKVPRKIFTGTMILTSFTRSLRKIFRAALKSDPNRDLCAVQ